MADNEVEIGVKMNDETAAGAESVKRSTDRMGDEVKRRFSKHGKDSAGFFFTQFEARLGPLMFRAPAKALGPALAPFLAVGSGFAIGLATQLTAALGGAITGAAGAGGIIGGLAIAAQDPRVQSQVTELSNNIASMLRRSAAAFPEEMISGIHIIESRILGIEGELSGIFNRSATFVQPLSEALGDALARLIEGLRTLIDESGPVIDIIGQMIPRFADAAADGLESLSDNTESTARAFGILLVFLEGVIRGLFIFINVASEAFEWMENIGGVLRGDFSPAIRNAYEENTNMADSNTLVKGTLTEVQEAIDKATAAAISYADALDRMVDQNMDAATAQLDYNERLMETKGALDDKKKVNAEERRWLLNLAKDTNDLTGALDAQGRTAAEAAEHHATLRNNFIAAAIAAGYSATEAKKLADQYLKIPKEVNTKIEADVDQAARNLRAVRDLIAQIRSKKVVITTQHNQVVTRSEGRNVPIGEGVGGRFMGGITGAQNGGLRGNLTMTGEYGRELLELPPSTKVHSNPDTERMLSGMGGGVTTLEIMARRTASRELMDLIIENLRYRVRNEAGGNSDSFFRGG